MKYRHLVLAIGLGLLLALPLSLAQAESLLVSEDTYIDAPDGTETHGSDTSLGICPVVDYWIYLKFDVAALVDVADAELRMTRIDGSRPEEISVYFILDDSWSEETLNALNRPEPTDPDPSETVAMGEDAGDYDRWTSEALTALIVQEAAGDGVLSLMLREDHDTNLDIRHYHSKEAEVPDSEKPQLFVVHSSSTEEAPAALADGIRLRLPFPNPSRARTTVSYELAESMPVSLRLYAIDGRLIRTLFDGTAGAGTHRMSWNGKDESGARVSSGLYVVVLSTPRGTLIRSVAALR